MKSKSAILYHIYYEDGWNIIEPYLDALRDTPFQLLINICTENQSRFSIYQAIKSKYAQAIIIFSPNMGKDIGGKLALIDLALRLKLDIDYYILLHDKKSPHSMLGALWRDKLFEIIKPEKIKKIFALFEKDPKIGIVGSESFIVNEYDTVNKVFNCSSNLILKSLMSKYALNPKDFSFVGGTMFWIRAVVLHSFFSNHAALSIRKTLEVGNVLDKHQGTQTHSWERMLCWLASDQQFNIKGIR